MLIEQFFRTLHRMKKNSFPAIVPSLTFVEALLIKWQKSLDRE
jgi:hypothetical protein